MRKLFIGSLVVLGLAISHWRNKPTYPVKVIKKISKPTPQEIVLVDKDRFPDEIKPAPELKREPSATPMAIKEPVKAKRNNPVSEIVIPGLPDNLSYIDYIKSIEKDKYEKSLGEIISEKGNLVFFKSQAQDDKFANVVYDKKTDAYFSISSVLKINQASDDLRQSLLGQGFEEYYYRKDIKLLFVQSTHSQVLETYQELLKKGVDAHLEIQNNFNQVR